MEESPALLNLPAEMIILIIKYLDTPTVYNIYNTCKPLREIITQGVVKNLKFSLNILSTADSLKTDFFKAVAYSLKDLSLSGMHDLTKTKLIQAVRHLKSLQTLDVTYTDISICDLLDIHPLCPTVKNIAINYIFGKLGMTRMTPEFIEACQNLLAKFENIHFVGSSINLMYSNFSIHVLNKTKLQSLKYTISECDYVCTTDVSNYSYKEPMMMVPCRVLFITILNWKDLNSYYGTTVQQHLLSKIDLTKYEYCIITMTRVRYYNIYGSELIRGFFERYFNIAAKDFFEDPQTPLNGNMSMIFWEKEKNVFNEALFQKLFKQLQEYFPSFINDKVRRKTIDWYYIEPDGSKLETERPKKAGLKRKIIAPTINLNYDDIFEDKKELRVSVFFDACFGYGVLLEPTYEYLKKLTYFSLTGSMRYATPFFDVLFSSCTNLVTFNLECKSIFASAVIKSKSLSESKSLKNFRILGKNIDFKALYLTLSECISLEKVYIIEDIETQISDVAEPSVLVEKCQTLRYLYIEAPVSEIGKVRKMQAVNRIKKMYNRNALIAEMYSRSLNSRYRYQFDPFIEDFHLSPIKPLDVI
ncbi:uncharacterized protein LOC114243967 [Bombyx mandarina]|uniref:F-box domain-containing protein n=2 Tax=Bombyx TaxID=7090 RepID=A0A8R1WGV8_BOMMO|nr:uncharacterized protein LOC101743259 [Bombyx mori]XP_028031437.1 uncharacterized protein LOC114243967 [Bombyx mandarina]